MTKTESDCKVCKSGTYIGIGMIIGIIIGAIFDNIAYWLIAGMLLGAAFSKIKK